MNEFWWGVVLGGTVAVVAATARFIIYFAKGWNKAMSDPFNIDTERGVEILAAGTSKVKGVILVRDGCDGSPRCALEIYAGEGINPLSLGSINLHFDGRELEQLYQAIKEVRAKRRGGQE